MGASFQQLVLDDAAIDIVLTASFQTATNCEILSLCSRYIRNFISSKRSFDNRNIDRQKLMERSTDKVSRSSL